MTAYADKPFYDRAIDRQKNFEKRRDLTNRQRDAICELIRPDLLYGNLDQQAGEEGKFMGDSIIEGTAPHSARVWQRGFMGNLVGRNIDWFRHYLKEPTDARAKEFIKFKGDDSINKYLQNFDEHMASVYKNSNYYDILPTYILDGGTVGSPVILAVEDVLSGSIVCTTPHYSQIFLDKDYLGRDNVFHNRFEFTALEAVEFFGKDNLPRAVLLQLTNGNHYEKTEYLQVIYAYNDSIFEDLKEGDQPVITHPWMEFYFSYKAQTDEKKALKRANKGDSDALGYFTKPFSAWHYHRNGNEVYARTPSWWAIQDVKGNNQWWEMMYEGAEAQVRPPMWMMGDYENLMDYGPGGENWSKSNEDYTRPPVPLKQGDYRVATDFADKLKFAVERHYHIKLFMMLQQLQEQQRQPVTAFQIFKMEGERQSQLIPSVQSFERGLLEPVDTRFIEIEGRANRLPKVPDIVLEFGDGQIYPQFTGPLSMAQKLHLGINKIHNGLMAADPIFERWPETKNKVRAAQLVEKILEEANFPQDTIVPKEEYDQIIAMLLQKQQIAEALEAGDQIADAVPKLQGETPTDSPLAEIAAA